MYRTRVIPCLLLKNKGLVKTVKFKNPVYIGDPVNAVKIFNEKEVDEIIFLDIVATREKRKPDFKLIATITSECFMPFCYGGGINTIDDMKTIFSLGVEKIAINTQAIIDMSFVKKVSNIFGSQSIVISIDVKKDHLGRYRLFSHSQHKILKNDPLSFALQMEKMGAGELFINFVDLDGTMKGFDLEFLKKITRSIEIPVIACGGAGRIQDFYDAVKLANVNAVSAGSMFIFHGKHKAVLISYPSQNELKDL